LGIFFGCSATVGFKAVDFDCSSPFSAPICFPNELLQPKRLTKFFFDSSTAGALAAVGLLEFALVRDAGEER
jgi:hypothetical protein